MKQPVPIKVRAHYVIKDKDGNIKEEWNSEEMEVK